MNPLITVMSSKFYRGYPDYPVGEAPAFERLSVALVRRHTTDAHFVAYYVPQIPRRLRMGVLGQVPVVMVLAVFDSDCAAVHGTKEPAPESWWTVERAKLLDLAHDHPDAFVYRSRGGYRIVYALDPITISSREEHDQWKRLYVGWRSYLGRCYGIVADGSCKDFTRHYRLPFVRRDGQLEQREVIGDADRVGLWNPRLLSSDLPVEKPKAKTIKADRASSGYAGRGRLFDALNARGWLGEQLDGVRAWRARCPFEADHTSGDSFDGSTVLYEAGPGDDIGWIHCMHAHCASRTALDHLRAVGSNRSASR